MNYHGFAARDYLILENLPLINEELTVLEIGVGTGSTLKKIFSRAKEFCGVDISEETINILKRRHNNDDRISFHCLNVCGNISLNKKFNIIYSADTLEHIEKPLEFFNFIRKHLDADGIGLITFPNESREKHHGITWFNRKSDLLKLIDSLDLQIIDFSEVIPTFWHQLIRRFLWDLPKSLVSRKRKDFLPQTFDQTEGFDIFRKNTFKSKLLANYARTVTGLAGIFPLYKLSEIGEEISNKILLIHLEHNKNPKNRIHPLK